MTGKILITIPYYDHPDTLRGVVERCLKQHTDILVVDDGSAITAVELLKGLDVEILTHEENRGKGEAILSAGRYAEAKGFSHIVTLDADAQYAPEEFHKFQTAIADKPNVLYVGCRDFASNDVPGASKFSHQFLNFWFRLQTGQSLQDYRCAYRAYPVPVLTELKYMFKTFAFEVEVLVRTIWAGLPCRGIEVSVYYPPSDKRISHFNKLKDNVRLATLNTHLTGRSITPWPQQQLKSFKETTGRKEPGKISILHPLRSLRRLVSENSSPGQLAVAAAIGMFIGTLPLFGLHTLLIIFASNFFRANKPFSISASQLCMPPLMPALCIEIGHYMRHGRFLTEISFETLGYQALERIWEWLLGSLIAAPAAAFILALTTFIVASGIKKTMEANGS